MPLRDDHRARLHAIARASIRNGLCRRSPSELPLDGLPPELLEPRATFVTLETGRRLRGCIGSLEARRPLAQDVHRNAYAAAFEDPRFAPLRPDEFDTLAIRISILHPPEHLDVDSEEALIRVLRPGRDGLILQSGARRATFLPAVWEDEPDPREFVRHLKRKAGLTPDAWPEDIRCWRYETESF